MSVVSVCYDWLWNCFSILLTSVILHLSLIRIIIWSSLNSFQISVFHSHLPVACLFQFAVCFGVPKLQFTKLRMANIGGLKAKSGIYKVGDLLFKGQASSKKSRIAHPYHNITRHNTRNSSFSLLSLFNPGYRSLTTEAKSVVCSVPGGSGWSLSETSESCCMTNNPVW